MDIVQRVQSIILKPKEEWVKIKAEPATVAGLFTSYAMILAAIPAVCQFLGNILVGRRLPMIGQRHRLLHFRPGDCLPLCPDHQRAGPEFRLDQEYDERP
jgi:hypothetical protein